jgi:hypothetical protein
VAFVVVVLPSSPLRRRWVLTVNSCIEFRL